MKRAFTVKKIFIVCEH